MKINIFSILLLSCLTIHMQSAESGVVRVASLTPGQVEEICNESFTYPSQDDLTAIFTRLGVNAGSENRIEKSAEFIMNNGGKSTTVGYVLSHIPVALLTGVASQNHDAGVGGTMDRRTEYLKAIFSDSLFLQLQKAGLAGAVSSEHSRPLPTAAAQQ